MKIIIKGDSKEIADFAMELQNRLSSKSSKSFTHCSFCGAKVDTIKCSSGYYTQEIIDVYRGLESKQKEIVETFIYTVLKVAMEDNSLAVNTKVHKSLNNTEKTKAEELAYLIARLPKQEQAKIYYMLKGFEIFGKIPEKTTA